jgi:hypothetical protein
LHNPETTLANTVDIAMPNGAWLKTDAESKTKSPKSTAAQTKEEQPNFSNKSKYILTESLTSRKCEELPFAGYIVCIGVEINGIPIRLASSSMFISN